jgi:hypothetical protein
MRENMVHSKNKGKSPHFIGSLQNDLVFQKMVSFGALSILLTGQPTNIAQRSKRVAVFFKKDDY